MASNKLFTRLFIYEIDHFFNSLKHSFHDTLCKKFWTSLLTLSVLCTIILALHNFLLLNYHFPKLNNPSLLNICCFTVPFSVSIRHIRHFYESCMQYSREDTLHFCTVTKFLGFFPSIPYNELHSIWLLKDIELIFFFRSPIVFPILTSLCDVS